MDIPYGGRIYFAVECRECSEELVASYERLEDEYSTLVVEPCKNCLQATKDAAEEKVVNELADGDRLREKLAAVYSILCKVGVPYVDIPYGAEVESLILSAASVAMKQREYERERCAKICEDACPTGGKMWTEEQYACNEALRYVADLIRAGGNWNESS